MRYVPEPDVYFIAETKIRKQELERFFNDIGTDWRPENDISDSEVLIEVGGRLCYRSWEPYDPNKPLCTNPNVTKVRKGNKKYLGNTLDHGHGSIFEHAQISMLFRDVSRVFTHELVRHRAGMAYSQESLRYVRLDDIGFWLPEAVRHDPYVVDKIMQYILQGEELQKELATFYKINELNDFHKKKVLTSAFRRVAPIGTATSILASGNLRAWRHIIGMRTPEGAEEEARLVIGKVAVILKENFPNSFQDLFCNDKGEWIFENEKV